MWEGRLVVLGLVVVSRVGRRLVLLGLVVVAWDYCRMMGKILILYFLGGTTINFLKNQFV